MKFYVTIEIKDSPDDTLPDIGTEIVEYESEEVAWRRATKIAELQNREFEERGLTQRGRVVGVELIST